MHDKFVLIELIASIDGEMSYLKKIIDTGEYQNVIIDLSRVGSSETKSLIMGMLVLKLQEHRMSEATGILFTGQYSARVIQT